MPTSWKTVRVFVSSTFRDMQAATGKNRSITADEVHYVVLDRTLKDPGFAYFYFRDDAAITAATKNSPTPSASFLVSNRKKRAHAILGQ